MKVALKVRQLLPLRPSGQMRRKASPWVFLCLGLLALGFFLKAPWDPSAGAVLSESELQEALQARCIEDAFGALGLALIGMAVVSSLSSLAMSPRALFPRWVRIAAWPAFAGVVALVLLQPRLIESWAPLFEGLSSNPPPLSPWPFYAAYRLLWHELNVVAPVLGAAIIVTGLRAFRHGGLGRVRRHLPRSLGGQLLLTLAAAASLLTFFLLSVLVAWCIYMGAWWTPLH